MENRRDFLKYLGFSSEAILAASKIDNMKGKIAIVGTGKLTIELSALLEKELPNAEYFDMNDPNFRKRLEATTPQLVVGQESIVIEGGPKMLDPPRYIHYASTVDLSPLSSLQKRHKRYKKTR